ncbi:MAG TPA: tRNA preQ1(34) S-adenosylmethionine ribosyltransferase-isomerase QueA [Candidatus Pacebacteria bacterium]|nr:tRNA preQ1(34) S-adenosylmethionine ribosyltransferase-isomerase QueA [Candidatus Paceibacterota bacterium]
MLQLSQFTYPLPPELIAQIPAEPRDSSRLMVIDRTTQTLSHKRFSQLDQILTANHVLVRNNTKVIPARILGHKTTGGAVEILLTHRLGLTAAGHERWECLTKPGLKAGQIIQFPTSSLSATCSAVTDYTREITFNLPHNQLFSELMAIGHTPIPPYIHWADEDETELREHYQTLYAKIAGSAAAPTAGLHFTPELDARLLAKGVEIFEVTLHVGLGTFLPVKTEAISKHRLHKEWFELTPEVAVALNSRRAAGKKLVAVGTTTTRVLESCADSASLLQAKSGDTEIFLYPPYKFRAVDALITNFHLPESSLLMLVAALVSAPNTSIPFESFSQSLIGQAYATAIAQHYRFFSFGDGMVIL